MMSFVKYSSINVQISHSLRDRETLACWSQKTLFGLRNGVELSKIFGGLYRFEAKQNGKLFLTLSETDRATQKQKGASTFVSLYMPKCYAAENVQLERDTWTSRDCLLHKDGGRQDRSEQPSPFLYLKILVCDYRIAQNPNREAVEGLAREDDLPECSRQTEKDLPGRCSGQNDVASQVEDCIHRMGELLDRRQGKKSDTLFPANQALNVWKTPQPISGGHWVDLDKLLSRAAWSFHKITCMILAVILLQSKPVKQALRTIVVNTQTPRASLSKALARVCQPLPSALSRSMT